MRSVVQETAAQQKREQRERLDHLAAMKHERALTLAGIIGHAAAHQHIWHTTESAEDYLTRMGVDLTII